MKFIFENLGALDKAEIELAELTLICGKNNTGKTYATYAIYALLATWRQLIAWHVENSDMERLSQKGAVSIDMQARFVDNWKEIQTSTDSRWREFLHHSLAAPAERFKDTSLRFEVDLDDQWKNQHYKRELRSEQGKIIFSAEKVAGSTTVEFAALKDDELREMPSFALEDFVSQALLESVLQPYFPAVFMVSTERTGAVAFKDELNLTKNKIVSLLAKMESSKDSIHPSQLFEAIYKQGYPLPVESNVQFVNRLASLEGRTSRLLLQHPDIAADFEALAGGRYETNKDGITQFIPKGTSAKLQLSEASSAVRSLVIFWYWLKAQAAPGHMLLIDEPELNLHPESQRLFARLLAKIVRCGVRVLLTTHSDTMVREFNTLIMLARDLPHLTAVREKYGYTADEKLSPNSVCLYIAQGKPKTPTGRKKRNSIATLELIKPDPKVGLSAEIFDHTILEMGRMQDDLRYGAE